MGHMTFAVVERLVNIILGLIIMPRIVRKSCP